jgi:hypothetical protein
LALYMFLYVYVAYTGNAATKSCLDLECSRQSGRPLGGIK